MEIYTFEMTTLRGARAENNDGCPAHPLFLESSAEKRSPTTFEYLWTSPRNILLFYSLSFFLLFYALILAVNLP
jgi:hypothetical protein